MLATSVFNSCPKSTIMKRLAIGLFLLAGTLVTANAYSQVSVYGGVDIRLPIPPPPVVVYQRSYPPPAPYYPVYRRAPQVVVVDRGYRNNRRYDRWDDCNCNDRHHKNNGRGRGHDRDDYGRNDRRY